MFVVCRGEPLKLCACIFVDKRVTRIPARFRAVNGRLRSEKENCKEEKSGKTNEGKCRKETGNVGQ